jgi:hypothetical protein
MAKRNVDLHKHTIMLYEGDYARLQLLHPEAGAASVVREIIRAYLNRVEPPIDTTMIKGDLNV